MFYIIRILLLCLLSNICFADQLTEKLQINVDKSRLYYQLPALSVSIKLPTEKSIRSITSGYYSLNKTKLIDSNTLFQVGSITKTFTAVLILQLVEENKLNLDDPITKYLPQYPHWNNIKIKNLLNHTSGLYNYTHGKGFDKKLRQEPNKIWKIEELADIAYQHPNQSLPDKKYLYTNTDYLLLGMILEKVTGKNLENIYADFFNKYHLENTYYVASGFPSSLKNRIAHGYNQDGTFPYNDDVTDVSISFSKSAGGIVSTPENINIFLQHLFSGKILSENSLKIMLAMISSKNLQLVDTHNLKLPHPLIKNTFAEIGIGDGVGLIYLNKLGYFFAHSGGMPGYESLYLYEPSKKIFLVLAYNLKPKKDFIDIFIAQKILNIVTSNTQS